MLYKQITANKRKTCGIVLLFLILVISLGAAVGYIYKGDIFGGMVVTGLFLVIYVPVTYLTASKQILGLSGAKKADENMYRDLYDITRELIIPARLPEPDIYVVQDEQPNAFATGISPERASIGVTTGLLKTLNREELEAVIAHELAHIKNYDIRLMTITTALLGVIIFIVEMSRYMMYFGGNSRRNNDNNNILLVVISVIFIVLAPLLGHIVSMAVSRNREYLADASAVDLTRNPYGMISALEKISGGNEKKSKKAKESMAAMYINNPFEKIERDNIFSTHPSISNRIKRLKEM